MTAELRLERHGLELNASGEDVNQVRALREGVHEHAADAGLALLVLLVVGMMIVPLPTWLLDLLIATQPGGSVVHVARRRCTSREALAFATFPTCC